MSDLLTARDLSKDSGFIDRVAVAAVEAAINITSESRKTPNHLNRAALARKVLMSPRRWGELMAIAVAVNGTINAKHAKSEEIPDGDIQFVVASLWDAYADSGDAEDGLEEEPQAMSAEAQKGT
jgi:hypothetical protein